MDELSEVFCRISSVHQLDESEAIERLTSTKSKVSSHYLIKNNGEIVAMVPDLYEAWHAGISSWKNFKSLNKSSIGIEISNPGHNFNYKKFSKKQIQSIKDLSKYLIRKYKDGHLITRNDVFFSLCKSIIGQQISVAAANSVFLKFKRKCKNKITAKSVNKLSSTSLKKCGLTRLKVRGIKDLAKKIINKKFKPSLIKKMNDEEAIEYLVNLRQIGRWSAEMILLFTFNRSNIWPLQDIGLLRAVSNNYKKKYYPPKIFLDKLYKKFTPYCSVATWYLWRSIDDEPIQY